MAKEIYIYTSLYSYSAEYINKSIGSVDENEDIKYRINSGGGEVASGFAVLSKMKERKGRNEAIVDGQAMSMMAFMLPFFDRRVANETSRLMFHKAAFSDWYKPSKSEQTELENMNAKFEKIMRSIVAKTEKGIAFLDKLFDTETRNDVFISPYEAMELGIIDEVRKLEPRADMNMPILAFGNEGFNPIESKSNTNSINNKSHKKMDKATLKAEHPELYAQIITEGKEAGKAEGIKAEQDRILAWREWEDVDPEAVKKGIKGTEQVSAKDISAFSKKAVMGAKAADHKADNPKTLETPKAEKTAEEIQAEAEIAKIRSCFSHNENPK